jgi:GT2 family glycosyltransferase
VVRGSTSAGHEAKSYVAGTAQRAVADHLARSKTVAEVLPAWGGYIRVRRPLPQPAPKVSVIIPTRNSLHLLRRCVESIFAQTVYPDFELLVVDNQSDAADALAYLAELESHPAVRVLRYDAPFNFAAITNFAVKQAAGELLCLLNNDTEAISPDWLAELASHAVRPEVGAVGAMLYYPDDTIQHAGVIVGLGGVAGHWHLGAKRGMTGYFGRAALIQDLSAVTAACMVLRRAVFDEVDGMDEDHLPVAYNDIDLCLRIREKGYRIVWTPYAELYHHESASRGKDDTPDKRARFQRESDWMRARWGAWMANDPAYNPNLTLLAAWPYLAHAPRRGKPWRSGGEQP